MEHLQQSEHHHDHHHAQPPKKSALCYFIARIASAITAKLIFKRHFIRNEIKGKSGPMVIIANHQCALDFVNLIGATKKRMTFVISESFYSTLPVKGIIKGMGVIPKQQFQTGVREVMAMKHAVDRGEILTVYPAGLMCEDGSSTPIPETTYKFLKWLGADIYVARSYGSYFVMPKWTKGLRRGHTYIDIYKLFSKDELSEADEDTVRHRVNNALLFDAYREQENLKVKYKNGYVIEGLENVLYKCPHCKSEFSMKVENQSEIFCEKCGFRHVSDEYGFLHNKSEIGEEMRYPSDWNEMILNDLYKEIAEDPESATSLSVKFLTVNNEKKRFENAGEGEVQLDRRHFFVKGEINGEMRELSIPTATFASLPFSPGKYFELQHGEEIFRCVPEDPRQVTKFVNKVKIYHGIATNHQSWHPHPYDEDLPLNV